jgi:regulatory protein
VAVQVVEQFVKVRSMFHGQIVSQRLKRRIGQRLGVLFRLFTGEKLMLHLIFENGQTLGLNRRAPLIRHSVSLPFSLDRFYFARSLSLESEVNFSMATISLIEKRGPVYRIYADGRLLSVIARESFERAPLREGDEVDEEKYLEKVALSQEALAYEAALSALDRSAKTEKALRRWLALRGFLEPAIETAIARLNRARLLNDSAIAEHLTESSASGGMSKYAIKRKLRAKGVGEEEIESALEGVSDEEQLVSAKRLAQKLYPRYEDCEKRAARAKLSQALARRGFSWDVISQALDGVFDS